MLMCLVATTCSSCQAPMEKLHDQSLTCGGDHILVGFRLHHRLVLLMHASILVMVGTHHLRPLRDEARESRRMMRRAIPVNIIFYTSSRLA